MSACLAEPRPKGAVPFFPTSDPATRPRYTDNRSGHPMTPTKQSTSAWPSLPFAEWESTCDTLHMWTQIVGKTRMALTPLENHWWNVPLYVTPCGLTTSAIPYKHGSFEVEFDFVAHQLLLRTSGGNRHCVRLYPRSVA